MKKHLIFILLLFYLLMPAMSDPVVICPLPDIVDPQSIQVGRQYIYIAERDRVLILKTGNPPDVKVLGDFQPVEKSTLVPMLGEKDIVMDCDDSQLFINNGRRLHFYSPGGRLVKNTSIPPISDYYLPVGRHYLSTSIGFFFSNLSYRMQVILYDSRHKQLKILNESPPDVFGPNSYSLKSSGYSLFPHCYRYRVYRDRIYLADTRKGFFIRVYDEKGKELYVIKKHSSLSKPTPEMIETWKKKLERNPGWRDNREWMKLAIPETLPAFRDFLIRDDRIYILPYGQDPLAQEIQVLDLEGNPLTKARVPAAEVFALGSGRYFYLIQDSHGEWDLAMADAGSGTGKSTGIPFRTIPDGRTPLHRAVMGNDQQLALSLIKQGKDLNTPDIFGYTPLLIAVKTGNPILARALIEQGADINAGSKLGDTPLHWAVRRGDFETANLLVSSGAFLKNRNGLGRTPEDLAVTGGSKDIVKLFYPLHLAVEKGDLETLKAVLLQNPGKINRPDRHGCTPLHLAERFQRKPMRKWLLEHGADPGMKDGYGLIPSDYSIPAMARRTGIQDLPQGTLMKVEDCVYDILEHYEHINIGLVNNGKIVLTRSYGKNSLNKDDVYASVSKVVTTMVFMQLLGKGKIRNLDDDIRLYSRKYRNSLPEKYRDSPISFRHLLTHSSGIPPARGSIWKNGKISLLFSPGQAQIYTTAGFGVLGEVMESITGKSFNQLVKEYIGKPVKAGSFWAENTFNSPGARVHSTIRDMARFAAGVIHNSYVPADVLYNEICRPYKGRLNLGWGCSNTENDDLTMGHAGSNGTPRAIILIKPRKKKAVCITGISKKSSTPLYFLPLVRNLLKILDKE